MLTANQFTVGSLADALPLSLVMPRRPGGPFVLVGWRGEEVVGVFVGPENRFRSIRCAGTANWVGLIVSNVRVEVDPISMFDPNYDDVPSGALVRRDTRLVAQAARESMSGPLVVTLADELDDAGTEEAGFGHWQIVVGEGLDKQVLHTVDVRKLTLPS